MQSSTKTPRINKTLTVSEVKRETSYASKLVKSQINKKSSYLFKSINPKIAKSTQAPIAPNIIHKSALNVSIEASANHKVFTNGSNNKPMTKKPGFSVIKSDNGSNPNLTSNTDVSDKWSKSKSKDDVLYNSNEKTVNQYTINNKEIYNSTTSDDKSERLLTDNLKQSYISEHLAKGLHISRDNNDRKYRLSPEKSTQSLIKEGINTEYFSALIGDKEKHHTMDRNNIPLVGRDYIKKEFSSVRPSYPSKNKHSHLIEKTSPLQKIVQGYKRSPIKRNPSINKPKIQEEEDTIDRKRSKSANNVSDRHNNERDIAVADIIGFIHAKQDKLPPFEPAKAVIKKYGVIEAFVVNTHKGYVRLHNEDRVSILLNAQNRFMKTKNQDNSKKNCSMFSVFDGHGGIACCNFLKDNLHNNLLEHLDVEGLVLPSIKGVYKKLDDEYTKKAIEYNKHFAGSCAITLIVINNSLIVVNTGDSRAVLSTKNGSRVIEASSDHKPDKLSELYRIIESGGELYRMSSHLKTGQSNFYFVRTYSQLKKINDLQKNSNNMIFGPWRVKPGGLSVSRSFGDIECKLPHMGGIPNVVTSEPDITEFDVTDVDFAFLACKLTSRWSL